MIQPSSSENVQFGIVNMAYDPHEQQTEGGDDKAWLGDICEAVWLFAGWIGRTDLKHRLRTEARFKPGLFLDLDHEDTLHEEHDMTCEIFGELCEVNGIADPLDNWNPEIV